jgi:hypothetical protein
VLEAVVGSEDAAFPGSSSADGASLEDLTLPTTKAGAAARIRAAGLGLRADVLRAAVQSEDAALLVRALSVFGGGQSVWGDVGEVGCISLFSVHLFRAGTEQFSQALDELLVRRAYALLLTAPALLFAYLAHRTEKRQALWGTLLREVAAHPEAAAGALELLVNGETRDLQGLTAVGADALPSSSSATAGPLDLLFADTPPVPMALLARVLQRGALFLSPVASRAALARVVRAFAERVESALAAPADSVPLGLEAGSFDAELQLLASVLAGRPDAADADMRRTLLPAVYVFAYVLPRAAPLGEDVVRVARSIWVQWKEQEDGGEGLRAEVVAEVKRRLSVLVCSTDVCVTWVHSSFFSFSMLTDGWLGRKRY